MSIYGDELRKMEQNGKRTVLSLAANHIDVIEAKNEIMSKALIEIMASLQLGDTDRAMQQATLAYSSTHP